MFKNQSAIVMLGCFIHRVIKSNQEYKMKPRNPGTYFDFLFSSLLLYPRKVDMEKDWNLGC